MTKPDPKPASSSTAHHPDVAAALTHKETKKRTDASLAATLFNRLAQFDADEAAELAESPADIKAKYAQRRAKALGEAGEKVVYLVRRMRGED